MNSILQNQCNFCFSFKRPGMDSNCCARYTCSTNNNIQCGASEKTLLQQKQQQYMACNTEKNIAASLDNNITNNMNISNQLTNALLTYGNNRFNKYYRPPPMIIPESVLKLQRETANVGVPRTIVQPCSGM